MSNNDGGDLVLKAVSDCRVRSANFDGDNDGNQNGRNGHSDVESDDGGSHHHFRMRDWHERARLPYECYCPNRSPEDDLEDY